MADTKRIAGSDQAPPPATSKRPRVKAPEKRREQLMDAAQRLLLVRGASATSIDDIVAATELAKGTFYLYFPSKEALLSALRERFVASFCQTTQAAMDRHRPTSYAAQLRSWIETAYDSYFQQLELHDLVFHQFTPAERDTMSENPLVDQLAALLRAGTVARAWSASDPKAIASMIFYSLHGAVDTAAADPSADRRRLRKTVLKFCESAVGGA